MIDAVFLRVRHAEAHQRPGTGETRAHNLVLALRGITTVLTADRKV
jgi:hypothetical protein